MILGHIVIRYVGSKTGTDFQRRNSTIFKVIFCFAFILSGAKQPKINVADEDYGDAYHCSKNQ